MKNRTTITNLTVSNVIDNQGRVDTIYTDFSKMFSRIDHGVILNKLKAIGFSDTLLI